MNPSSTNRMTTASPIILTPMDVERLLNDPSSDSRASILEKIGAHYNEEKLHGREQEIAEQIFRLLMKDVGLRVRESLAERLKDNPNVPRDIVLHMANDVESVAVPVLSATTVLSDADLVSIVEKSPDMAKLIAISARKLVSERVSDALVETRYAQVMQSLLHNEGTSISERALGKIVSDFSTNKEIMEALAQKPRLPITIVERIITQASDAVATQLKAQYKLNDTDAKKNATEVREDFILRILEQDMGQREVEVLVAQMAKEERLTPSIVMTALCRGQLLFFTIAMAQFAGIATSNAMRLVEDRGEHGFNGLYQKSGLPESMMDAVRLLLRAVQDMKKNDALPGSRLYANRLAEQVIVSAGSQQIEYLPYFIALIRQNTQRP
jgi:uncharacterized protein (DUF2336 family)